MKITVLGTGCIWTKRACASYLVNDNIIVDPGVGTLKQLLKSCNTLLHHEKIEKIKLILITHYHIDHYFDIVLLMWKIASEKNPNANATIICPPGGEEKIKTLCKLGMSDDTFKKLNFDKYIKFVDASNLQKFEFKNIEITPIKMDHGSIDCYGYMLKEKCGKTVGFSGDTTQCDGMQFMIDHSDVAFVDMAGTDISNKHFNIIDGIKLMKEYKGKCNIIPSHLTSQAIDYCSTRINTPNDLMVVDSDDKVPYDFEIKPLKTKTLNSDFKFEKEKFAKLEGEIFDLKLSSTKTSCSNFKYPTYFYDVLTHNKNKVGEFCFSIVPNEIDGHNNTVCFKFFEGYDSQSIKNECCMLIKPVAKYHSCKHLFLSCSPKDFETRKVFESLGAYLKEIKTQTFLDENGKRQLSEQCIFVWEID